MKDADSGGLEITPGLLLRAYAAGVFPMANSAEDEEIFWVEPRQRGILPLHRFHMPRSLRKTLRREHYRITIDTAFDAVLDGCADRPETWINGGIRSLYSGLFSMGHAHSVEVWVDGELGGGIYGVRLGGAFFGESMFSRVRDGSKIALSHLVARLIAGGFTLLDTQFTTSHLEWLGARTVPRSTYKEMLADALQVQGDFWALSPAASSDEVLQLITQRS